MALPLSYNIRNIAVRWQVTALAVGGIALVVALIGGFVALDQRQEAVQERRVAFVRELAAAADANVEEDPEPHQVVDRYRTRRRGGCHS